MKLAQSPHAEKKIDDGIVISSTMDTAGLERKSDQGYPEELCGEGIVNGDFKHSWRKLEAAAQDVPGWRRVVCDLCSIQSSKSRKSKDLHKTKDTLY